MATTVLFYLSEQGRLSLFTSYLPYLQLANPSKRCPIKYRHGFNLATSPFKKHPCLNFNQPLIFITVSPQYFIVTKTPCQIFHQISAFSMENPQISSVYPTNPEVAATAKNLIRRPCLAAPRSLLQRRAFASSNTEAGIGASSENIFGSASLPSTSPSCTDPATNSKDSFARNWGYLKIPSPWLDYSPDR